MPFLSDIAASYISCQGLWSTECILKLTGKVYKTSEVDYGEEQLTLWNRNKNLILQSNQWQLAVNGMPLLKRY